MPRISDIGLLHKREQPVLCVRATTSVQNLPALIGGSYGKMAAYLAELGESISDMPYVGYFNQDMNALEVEIGFPVAKPLPEKEGIVAGTVPEGLVAFCIYRGAYGDMVQTYGELHEWITKNGYVPTGAAFEHYFNGPGVPESDLLTMISMPVKKGVGVQKRSKEPFQAG